MKSNKEQELKRGLQFAFCTYCSGKKDPSHKLFPAILRYQSERIHKVYLAACCTGISFFILSGEYGLISPEKPIPHYDHLLELCEVSTLTQLVQSQLRDAALTGMIFFTENTRTDQKLAPYLQTIVSACKHASVQLTLIEWEG